MINYYRYWKNYLLILSTCSYGAGIFLFSSAIFSGTVNLLPLGVILVVFMVLKTITQRFLTFLLVVLIFFFFGAIQGTRNSVELIDESHIAVKVGNQQQIAGVGTLVEMVSESRNTSRAKINISYIRTETEPEFKKGTGSLLLVVKGPWPETIVPGQSIIFQATAQIPSPAAAPGAFDYRRYLARKKIYLTAVVNSPILVQPVDDIQATVTQNYLYAIERYRTHIARYIDKTLPPNAAALYKALIVGDRSSIDPEVLENIKRAGVLHLWAISGMHLGLLTVTTYSFLYWLLRRSERLLLKINVKKVALFLTLPPLLLYALLAGFQPPAARAFIMTACLVISLGCNRTHSTMTTLTAAALIILLFDPPAIQSASFQLSFSAVAAIVLITPKILTRFNLSINKNRSATAKVGNLLLSLATVTVSATLGTLPLLLCHFHRFSLVTLPANLLVQPVILFVSLPLGMLSLPFIWLYPPVAALLLNVGAMGLTLANTIAAIISTPDFTQLWLPSPHPLLIMFYYLLLLIWANQRLASFSSLLSSIGFISIIFIIMLPFHHDVLVGPKQTRVAILAVGHGSANAIKLKSGRVVLIDGGARSTPGFDCGSQIIAPYLWHSKISKVDDIIITHEDADHYNGILSVIKRFKPERLWLPPLGGAKHGFSQLIDLARNRGIAIIFPKPGVIIEEKGDQISVLGGESGDDMENEDDRGLVLKLNSGKVSVLFPGDITKAREFELVRRAVPLKSSILLSPHHGSATSNSFAFLSAVSPEILVFSTGKSGKFPSQEALVTVQQLDIATLNTSEAGTITIEINDDGSGYQLFTANESQDRYWRNG